jgi:hypothetical protein
MSDEEAKRHTPVKPLRFRSSSSRPQISREAAAREGSILRAAVAALGLQGAQAFLNGHNDQLDGRPLAIAASSVEGYVAVSAAISTITPVAPTIAA